MGVLLDRFGVSERRACRLVGQHRSTQRRPPRPVPEEEQKLRGRLREIAREHPRWGWKTALVIVRREGWHVNRKRVQRLWREEGLKRPATCRKRRRFGPSVSGRLRAERPNQVWAVDFQFDETADQRRLKMANVVDEFTRECLAIRVGRSCTADQLVDLLEALVLERGAPEYLRMDNGPEMVAWALRDWCRLSGMATTYIEPGSPWENPFVESFNGRFRDECLNVEEFWDLPAARVIVEDWRIEYNTFRPHSALGGLTPAEFAKTWDHQHQPGHPQ
ncbi:MAG TPA: IS3 family transposase [Acidimicrobiales bacterium]|nr:IS3 family transposase [Acidimicrobiales bacterium]